MNDREPRLSPVHAGFFPPWGWPFLAAGLSALGLGVALWSQYVGGLAPCHLCLYQRWPHGAIILASAIAAFLIRRSMMPPAREKISIAAQWLMGFAALAALTGAAIAGYHVGVEQGWWPGGDDCVAPFGATSLEALRAEILAAPVIRCTDIPWSFLGLSMAAYNALLSLGLAALCATGSWHLTWHLKSTERC